MNEAYEDYQNLIADRDQLRVSLTEAEWLLENIGVPPTDEWRQRYRAFAHSKG